MFQQALLPIFCLSICFLGQGTNVYDCFWSNWIHRSRNPQLITITKTLEILNRLNFHESIIILPFISQKMMTALTTLNYFFKLYTSKFLRVASIEKSCAWLVSKTGTILCWLWQDLAINNHKILWNTYGCTTTILANLVVCAMYG